MSNLKVSPPKNHTPSGDQYHVNAGTIADIQRGLLAQPTFFGNHGSTGSGAGGFQSFLSGLGSLQTTSKSSERTDLTPAQLAKLETVAKSMALFGAIPIDVARDFLTILIRINDIDDFAAVLLATGLAAIIPTSYMRDVDRLLNVKELSQAAFLANALAGLIKAFAQYLRSSQQTSGGTSPMNAILSAFGLGGSASAEALMDAGSIEQRLGNFLSELVLGERIPIPVIAQNPMKEPPSYVGKVFFGELVGVMSHVDITELFPKKIAAFPEASSGAGMSSFNFQNMAGFAQGMPMTDLISNMNFGGADTSSGFMNTKATAILDQMGSMLGVSGTDKVEMRRADNAIPVMIALSAVNTGRETSPFPTSSFQDGWTLASSVTQFIQNNDSAFLTKLRGGEET